ncbi:MAG TPA: hypothetical protein VH230_08190, partial [Stellaceae bacterium]|nr:hypothetical protein [Stellaceae bacterium]
HVAERDGEAAIRIGGQSCGVSTHSKFTPDRAASLSLVPRFISLRLPCIGGIALKIRFRSSALPLPDASISQYFLKGPFSF